MVVSPHCDDSELGVGGYMAKKIQQGWEVIVVVATVSSIKFLHNSTEVSHEDRISEFRRALECLGVTGYHTLTLNMDGKLHLHPMSDLVKQLDEIQEHYKPDEVLIPLPSAHQDHRTVWEACVASTRPSPAKHNPRMIAAYEYPLTGWGPGSDMSAFRGGLYVDISEQLDLKLEALKCYESQMRGENEQISLEGAKALARLRGVESGCSYAELFHILRLRG